MEISNEHRFYLVKWSDNGSENVKWSIDTLQDGKMYNLSMLLLENYTVCKSYVRRKLKKK